MQVHLFDGYWEDIGTIKSFFEGNLALAANDPPFELANAEAPIYTRPRFLPPSKFDGATVTGSLIADGCEIGPGAVIENSVIGLRCMIGENVTIKNTVIMGADEYESPAQVAQHRATGQPPLGLGDGCHIDGAIVDKNVRIGKNVRLVNEKKIDNTPEEAGVSIRDGIVCVEKDATLGDNFRL